MSQFQMKASHQLCTYGQQLTDSSTQEQLGTVKQHRQQQCSMSQQHGAAQQQCSDPTYPLQQTSDSSRVQLQSDDMSLLLMILPLQ